MKTLFIAFSLISFLTVSCQADTPQSYFGVAFEGLEADLSKGNDQKVALREFFLQWSNEPSTFDWAPIVKTLDTIDQSKAIPVITWEPFYFVEGKKVNVLLEDLKNKKFDNYIDQAAKTLKTWGKPVIVRLMHEMNLKDYQWGTSEGVYDSKSPKIYQEMFKYIVDRYKAQGTQNVFWAFCPNIDSIPNEPWNIIEAYYPGDHYVDILGLDGYNWKIPPSDLGNSFAKIFSRSLKELKNLNSHLPVVVFETASVGEMQQKQAWLMEALTISALWNIKALIWFDIKKENDWRIILTPEIIALISSPPFPTSSL